MEAFSLLRYWRSNAADASGNANVRTSTASATTIVTSVTSHSSDTGDDEDEDNDHGPFFDLEFSLPPDEEGGDDEHVKNGESESGVYCCEEAEEEDSDGSEEDDDERELKFTLMSGSSGGSTADANVSVSPSDELFFKGSFVPVDQTMETNSKPPQLRVSLMKSATKFRVMMLKFKKSKLNVESSEGTESNASGSSNSKEEQKKAVEGEKTDSIGESEDSGKSMTLNFKVEEVPIVSLFKRHNSSKTPKKRQNDDEAVSASSEEKKFSKEAMQRYLRKVKPLYVRVSKRYGEKLKFSGQLSLPGATRPNIAPSPATEEQQQSPAANTKREKEPTPEVSEPPLLPSNAKGLKQGNLPAGLRMVCKHLGKSRSASTAVVAAAPPGTMSSKRRDDSLLQQQDGIQSAILHCKRSFKASRDSDSSSKSTSDPAEAYGKRAISSSSEAVELKKS